LEIHIEARQKDCLVEDIIKEKYFEFYTETLRDSEEAYSFFDYSFPWYAHIINSNYILILLISI
jgi:hypothetical protein